MSSVVLTSVTQAGQWRVKLVWPHKTPHYFGKFQSQAEAELWIAEHHWLTKRRQEADAEQAYDPEAPNDG